MPKGRIKGSHNKPKPKVAVRRNRTAGKCKSCHQPLAGSPWGKKIIYKCLNWQCPKYRCPVPSCEVRNV